MHAESNVLEPGQTRVKNWADSFHGFALVFSSCFLRPVFRFPTLLCVAFDHVTRIVFLHFRVIFPRRILHKHRIHSRCNVVLRRFNKLQSESLVLFGRKFYKILLITSLQRNNVPLADDKHRISSVHAFEISHRQPLIDYLLAVYRTTKEQWLITLIQLTTLDGRAHCL